MHPRTTRTLRWSHPATLAALLHSSLFLLTLSPAPSSTHTFSRAVLSLSLHNNPFFVKPLLSHGYHCIFHEDPIQHGITKLLRSPMITCDQVVSGGSAERTTKMAAAPAADSLSILLLAHQPFSLITCQPLFLLPLITRYFLSLPSPLF